MLSQGEPRVASAIQALIDAFELFVDLLEDGELLIVNGAMAGLR